MGILNFLKGEKKMKVEPMYLMNEGKVFSGEYKDIETRDIFDMKDEEIIRNEVINVLAKHNVSYWKAEVILNRAKVFLKKESVVQEIK